MLSDDPAGLGAQGARRQHVFVGLDGEDLSAHQARHADPVQKAKDHKEAEHVGAHLRKHRALKGVAQHLIEHHGKEDDHEGVGQGVDNIDDAHHD